VAEVAPLWPHQFRGVVAVQQLLDGGARRILLTSHTGGGKSRVMAELIKAALELRWPVALYTNRRWLLEQLSGVLHGSGLEHGVRAAGHFGDDAHALQISSIQTETTRLRQRQDWSLHPARLVLVDEAHLQKGPTLEAVLAEHLAQGAQVVGFTATPLDLGGLYDELVIAGTNSELRDCGALVLAEHFGPDEPDLRQVPGLVVGQDLTEKQAVSAIMRHGIFGRVFEWWQRLNPQRLPTLLFAPGVAESLWFAQEFWRNGVAAAHIDARDVWINGQTKPATPESRREVLRASQNRDIAVLSNRFVVREGLDLPWLGHGILATVFGSLQSYLQAGGRLLRAHPGLERVVIQDHGGNWHRHGSLNEDRSWDLGASGHRVTAQRIDRMREGHFPQPRRCPKCAAILRGALCRACGHRLGHSATPRPVVQSNGSLVHLAGDVYKPRRLLQHANAAAMWERYYHRAKSPKWNATFAQASALFAAEHGWQWPARDLPLMPRDPLDFYLPVREVPYERLIPKPPEEPGHERRKRASRDQGTPLYDLDCTTQPAV
jgi:superfamily II DNA or RNA helicase